MVPWECPRVPFTPSTFEQLNIISCILHNSCSTWWPQIHLLMSFWWSLSLKWTTTWYVCYIHSSRSNSFFSFQKVVEKSKESLWGTFSNSLKPEAFGVKKTNYDRSLIRKYGRSFCQEVEKNWEFVRACTRWYTHGTHVYYWSHQLCLRPWVAKLVN